jgi:hypothetical protein
MEKIETLIRYIGSPVAFAALVIGGLVVGTIFLIIGAFSYVKLTMSTKMGPGIF